MNLLTRLKQIRQPNSKDGQWKALLSRLATGEAWTNELRRGLEQFDVHERDSCKALLEHCASATSSRPSAKWRKHAAALVELLSVERLAPVISRTLKEIGKPGQTERRRSFWGNHQTDPTQIHVTHSELLRGIVWCAGLFEDQDSISALGQAAEACFKKLPGIGPRSPKIGNACLWALANIGSTDAVAQLSRLKTKVRHASVRKQLAKALQTAAETAGVSPEELEEIAVPTFGFTQVGEHRRPVGDYTARLSIVDTRKTQLEWVKPDGKTQKSVPKAIKDEFVDEIKSLKQAGKEIEKLLPAHRDRIEQLYLQKRSWSPAEFRARYLDHTVVGAIARRLIWRFDDGSRASTGIWHDGRIVDASDEELDQSREDSRVTLWHPIDSGIEEVRRWRDWLEAHSVRQPFKQAHREVYILTDAERRTETYSNRFAAHVLRQHQFAALCQQRGWRYALQGAWDSHNTPFVDIPTWNIRAEFWVDAAGEDDAFTSEAGIYLYVCTDQVRFYEMGHAEPMTLEDVPPLVFSEIMRDVDLFVGVASVGNDPNWADGGPEGRYVDYWQSYSFGDLSATAQTRKEVLQRLIPRLKIAPRCSFSDKFLVVRGDVRTYKIHLGSGNILMEPNDQYLCIVPARGSAAKGAGRVFLPFEGDERLSIILSKAMLLAEDGKIKDRTIVSQIKP